MKRLILKATAFLVLAAFAGNAFAASPKSAAANSKQYPITTFGAVADGHTVNTKAIQSAIDTCAAKGGGIIVVPEGVFVSGALFFKQGVSLELESNAVLKATSKMADYPPVYTSWEGVERYWTAGFLNFIGMNDVTVAGTGTIDGSGLDWPSLRGSHPPSSVAQGSDDVSPHNEAPYPKPLPTTATLNFAPDPAHLPTTNASGIALPAGGSRLSPPRTIVFQNCEHVYVSGIALKNQARWGLVFIYCRDVVAENLNIHIDRYIPSSDGIDVCSSSDVQISHCDIACTDDNISIKSGKDADGWRVNRPSENITISDCTFGTGGGVAIGSEVSGSIRHVLVQRCTFNGTGSAARVKSQPSRGGVIEDITWRDIKLVNARQMVDFNLAWRMVPPLAPPAPKLTVARKLRLINFSGTAASGGIISGLKDSPILGLSFKDCNVKVQRGLVLQNANAPDLSGLHIDAASGEPVLHRNAKTQREEGQ